MTDYFVPWDATDEEVAKYRAFEELIPSAVRAPLMVWLTQHLTEGRGAVPTGALHHMQVSLREDFEIPVSPSSDYLKTDLVMERLAAKGDRVLMRAADWALSTYSHPHWEPEEPHAVQSLRLILDRGGATARVSKSGPDGEGYCSFRLEHRLPAGAADAAGEALEASSLQVRGHLDRAWEAFRRLEPDTSKAMTEAVKAAEIAVRDAVAPKDGRPRMMKFVKQLEGRDDWTVRIDVPSDDAFSPRKLVTQALRGLVLSQSDRHGGEPPKPPEALAHLMLASLVVGWFESGAVVVPQRTRGRSLGETPHGPVG